MKELALHVLDIAENSVRARADRIKIEVLENVGEDVLEIAVEDNGEGMDEAMMKRVRDPFFTGQSKKKKIGLGIPLLEQLAEHCDGKLDISSQPRLGTKVRACFRRSHIDLPPLGSMADTLIALFGSHPHIDIIYEHEVEECRWSFSSRKLLEEIGLTTLGEMSQVLPGIRDWIEYHEQHLQEGAKNL